MAQQKAQSSLTIIDTTDIDRIENYYLATNYNVDVSTDNGVWGNWTLEIQSISEEAPYLWNYERIIGTGESDILITTPHIIGMFSKNGIDGEPGLHGRGIAEIQDYYLVSNELNIISIIEYILAEETTPQDGIVYYTYDSNNNIYIKVDNPAGQNPQTQGWYKNKYNWSTQIQLISNENKYLWNYEHIIYTDEYEEFIGPRLLGTYGEQGIKGDQGDPGTSCYTWILYSPNNDGSNWTEKPAETTKYIGICITTENERPLYNDTIWNWSKYIGDDGSVITKEVILYYLKTDNNTVPIINNGSLTYTKNNNVFSINTISVVNEWTTVIPSYQNGGIYYTCTQTFLDNNSVSPIYSDIVENPSLTDSKKDIQGLLTKTAKIIQRTTDDPGLIVAGGEITDVNIQNKLYGYNSIAASNYFGLRYNTQILAEFTMQALSFYNPTTNKPQIVLGTDGLIINSKDGIQLAQYGNEAIIGDPRGIRITIDSTDGIQFWSGENNRVAYMNSSVLGIEKTLAFDKMNIGDHWEWDYDEDDSSLILKWSDTL